jgi:hypothetical protein
MGRCASSSPEFSCWRAGILIIQSFLITFNSTQQSDLSSLLFTLLSFLFMYYREQKAHCGPSIPEARHDSTQTNWREAIEACTREFFLPGVIDSSAWPARSAADPAHPRLSAAGRLTLVLPQLPPE